MAYGILAGFVISSFFHNEKPDPSATAMAACSPVGRNWFMLLPGLFMILIGIGFIWQPLLIRPYLIAIFLILLGIGFVIRGIRKE